MKQKQVFGLGRRILAVGVAVMIPALSTSCSTTYDSYGNPRQSVDPAVAVAGVVAAGLIGYALADDDGNRNHKRGHGYGHGGNHYRGHDRRYSSYGGSHYRGGRGNVCY
ncbi:MAG: hypothetical protein AB8D78_11610 [Akkermansiaceae bacterium]